MIGTALVLIALSLGDWVASGLAGEPRSNQRILAGLMLTMTTAVVGTWWIGFELVPALLVVSLASAGTAAWSWAKSSTSWRLALSVIAAG